MHYIKGVMVTLLLGCGVAQAYPNLPREELPITPKVCTNIRGISTAFSTAIRSGSSDEALLQTMVNMGVQAQKDNDVDMRVATAMAAAAVHHVRESMGDPDIAEIMKTTTPHLGLDEAMGLKMMTICSHKVGETYSTAILVVE